MRDWPLVSQFLYKSYISTFDRLSSHESRGIGSRNASWWLKLIERGEFRREARQPPSRGGPGTGPRPYRSRLGIFHFAATLRRRSAARWRETRSPLASYERLACSGRVLPPRALTIFDISPVSVVHQLFSPLCRTAARVCGGAKVPSVAVTLRATRKTVESTSVGLT